MNEARNQYKDKFCSDDIKLGKTSTKRATNLASLKEDNELKKILEGKNGQ